MDLLRMTFHSLLALWLIISSFIFILYCVKYSDRTTDNYIFYFSSIGAFFFFAFVFTRGFSILLKYSFAPLFYLIDEEFPNILFSVTIYPGIFLAFLIWYNFHIEHIRLLNMEKYFFKEKYKKWPEENEEEDG
jgi:hypothetical protein